MRRNIVILALLIAAVAGCSRIAESRFNPFNWFGRSQPATTLMPAQAVVTDPRQLVAQVLTLRVEQAPGGAIVRATGLPPRQGYWDGELVPQNGERPVNGTLTYQFRISPPFEPTRVGPQRSREVVVGRFVSTQRLAGVRAIRVSGAQNALAARR